MREAGIEEKILERVACLDAPEERRSILALQEVRNKIENDPCSGRLLIYNQFEGKALRSYVKERPKHRSKWKIRMSEEGLRIVHSRKEKGTALQRPPGGSFYLEGTEERLSVSQHQPRRNQDRDRQ